MLGNSGGLGGPILDPLSLKGANLITKITKKVIFGPLFGPISLGKVAKTGGPIGTPILTFLGPPKNGPFLDPIGGRF